MNILIVEDHNLLAHTLAGALRREGFRVDIAELGRQGDPLDEVATLRPELVLLDLDLGEHTTGLDLIAPLRAQGCEVVVLTGNRDELRHAECVEAGALGVIGKHVSFDALVAVVSAVAGGSALLAKHERDDLLARLRLHRASLRHQLEPFEGLTNRERQVLAELMAGTAPRDIARSSFVSVTTVRTQIRSILSKLNVNSQLAAVSLARQVGWRPPAVS